VGQAVSRGQVIGAAAEPQLDGSGPDANGSGDSPAAGGENRKERLDRELMELLQGLRVATTGVQVLFAFLLTVPFAQGFRRVTEFQKEVYLVTLMAATIAGACYIAPAAQHRVLFRSGAKEILLRRSNRFTMVGSLSLGVAMSASVLLVTDYLFSRATAWLLMTVVAAAMLWSWAVQPLLTRARKHHQGVASR
jgi:Family of unknown function (DUF6328)